MEPPLARAGDELRRTTSASTFVFLVRFLAVRLLIRFYRLVFVVRDRIARQGRDVSALDNGMPKAAGAAGGRQLHRVVRRPVHAVAHPAESTSACSSTVCVAFSCLSGG